MNEATPQSSLGPTEELTNDHRVIQRVLNVLEILVTRARSGGGFEADAFGSAVEFFRLFADACHHAKEEDLLFPVLEKRGVPREGGPIGVMLDEHRMAREHTARMHHALVDRATGGDQAATAEERLLSAAEDYLQLLRAHIFKEDNVLFRMGDQVLTESDRESLTGQFCDVRCRAFDGKTREQLESIATDLEATWSPSE